MVLNEVFEQYVKDSPISVMQRALMENFFSPAKLNAVFHEAAVTQYERELLFSDVVDAMSLVVGRITPSVRAAYFAKKEKNQMPVSQKAFYDKLSKVELTTSRALVLHTSTRARELIDRMKGQRKPLLSRVNRVLILDGSHPAGTDHRLKVLRPTAAGALPGLALVILDPQYMLVEDVVLCENGHSQERSLLDQVLPSIRKGDLVIDDRNFCTLAFLAGIHARKAYFITRQHGRTPWTPEGRRRYVGRCSTGKVYEQAVILQNPETKKVWHVRRITVLLANATRDGDSEIHLFTNLPTKKANGVRVAELYRGRWKLEHVFNELTTHLQCEPNTLGYPKAALFAYCVALCCYNLLAVVKGALRSVHGEKVVEMDVSNYYLALEIRGVYQGMMIALPPRTWERFQTTSLKEFADQMHCWAKQTDITRYPKSPTRPKKPRPPRPNARFKHVATAELLEKEREKKRKANRRKAKLRMAESDP
jgi:hypothetical protein